MHFNAGNKRTAMVSIYLSTFACLLASVATAYSLNYNADLANSTIGFKSIPHSDNDKAKKLLSEDCIAQRNEILRRHHITPPERTVAQTPAGYQSLRPKNENSSQRPLTVAAADLLEGNGIENEHIPQCTPNGKYVPTQCHKMGYCWCVNKFGQAIRNSAVEARESPNCDLGVYQSGGVESMVVTDIRPNRLKAIMRIPPNSQRAESLGDHQLSDLDLEHITGGDLEGGEATASTSTSASSSSGDDEFRKRVSASQEPSLSLAANQCELSRIKAKERASRHLDDSIWIPECDQDNPKLYAEKQCKSKICWCVNKNTGLPLLTSEQLTAHVSLNCTEMKRLVEVAQSSALKQDKHNKPQYYQGFSKHCDANKRADFARYMVNQFRQQISEYTALHPTSPRPEGIMATNPHGLPDQQVMVWKFNLLDSDHNKKLEDREWSKFKIDFKFVEKIDDVLRPIRLSPGASWSPLGILRFQRHCWRDFLEFCDNGNLLVRDSINLTRWLTCLELPSKVHPLPPSQEGRGRDLDMDQSLDNAHANTREAAINRSKEKNPFTSILRAD